MKLVTSLGLLLFVCSSVQGQKVDDLEVHNTRNTNEPPSAFNRNVRFDF